MRMRPTSRASTKPATTASNELGKEIGVWAFVSFFCRFEDRRFVDALLVEYLRLPDVLAGIYASLCCLFLCFCSCFWWGWDGSVWFGLEDKQRAPLHRSPLVSTLFGREWAFAKSKKA
jgi:hypothetical protein